MPVDHTYELVQQFTGDCSARAVGNSSTPGLRRCGPARTAQLQGFVTGVERDKKAVKAGLTLPQSNGGGEGKVNKLKLTSADDVWPC